ncbi:hypothetical protein [Cellulomonas rhizosphaerae]|uniref:Uncharacterized protein n=1 Tax=Cellulomonas rhizosphaerae TaxID=2293719 RepID=A0A413RH70_9CELL|nr:hypothetical protein [Cellulomonas rhizosphaerae]RHA37128.1 hypothetical protein D1825_17760 [Cellulomonas rhizosphaerae]
MPTLSTQTLAVVRRVWAARLRVDERALASCGVALVEREDLDAVVVVALGESVVATGPAAALGTLASLEVGQLLVIPDLLAALRDHAPVPIGAATLAYAEPSAGTPTAPPPATRSAACWTPATSRTGTRAACGR